MEWGLHWRPGGHEPSSISLPWQATLLAAQPGRPTGSVLTLAGVTAWCDAADPADVPDPGHLLVQGHIGVPDGVARTTGLVRRVRVVRQSYRQLGPGRIERVRVPGVYALRDVARSPRWFADDPPSELGDETARDAGVLVDRDVAATEIRR